MKLFKTIIAVLSIILAVGYALELSQYFKFIDTSRESVRFFALGFAGFLPVWFLVLRRHYFYSTFEHEFTHLIVGLLFLKKPAGFEATERDGGVTVLYGSNFVITLGPYFLPTFVFLLFPLYLAINSQCLKYYFLVLGLLTSYHIFSTIQEFSYRQPDIIKSGKVFSTIFLIFTNILSYGIIITFVAGGFKMTGDFIVGGIFELKDLYLAARNLL
ncbi:MAG: M50 family metallopeptidase [Candidatus Cloacimonetes bacterium]|nr:M50 family metallopeptidase [Candidatus Cloacimonadota bacterium]